MVDVLLDHVFEVLEGVLLGQLLALVLHVNLFLNPLLLFDLPVEVRGLRKTSSLSLEHLEQRIPFSLELLLVV